MRYAIFFAVSVICLTVVAVTTFDHISVTGTTAARDTVTRAMPTADTLPTPGVATPAMPTAADYAHYADADRAWREKNARQYTVVELRARGDGKRTERDGVQDRVFQFVQSQQRTQAIAELERWVREHPTDRELLLSLARLLTEAGRSDAAIGRYRQILALHGRGE